MTAKKKTTKKVTKKKETEKPKVEKKLDGLNQTFKTEKGGLKKLANVLTEEDVWETKGRTKMTILTHEAVKKLADMAGVQKNYKNRILTQPDAYNNYQYTWEVEVCNHKGECSTGIGEANRSNLGARGRRNPANMAEKRAYDRAVLRLLGITGLLSEEELPDEESENKMDTMPQEEQQQLAPIVNQLLLAKDKDDLIIFNREMKDKASQFSPESLDYLRKMYKKRLANIQGTEF